MAVTSGWTTVSAWVAVVFESSAMVYQYRISVTQFLLNVYSTQSKLQTPTTRTV